MSDDALPQVADDEPEKNSVHNSGARKRKGTSSTSLYHSQKKTMKRFRQADSRDGGGQEGGSSYSQVEHEAVEGAADRDVR